MLGPLAWLLRLDRAAAHDSFYLALAEELECDLWTADRHLVGAVDVAWVRVAGASCQCCVVVELLTHAHRRAPRLPPARLYGMICLQL